MPGGSPKNERTLGFEPQRPINSSDVSSNEIIDSRPGVNRATNVDDDPRLAITLLRDPVTLSSYTSEDLLAIRSDRGYYDFIVGDLSRKNDAEMAHFAANYHPASAADKSYLRRLPFIEHPDIHRGAIVVDLGCGPYRNIELLGGIHLLIDDLMGFYCRELNLSEAPGVKLASRAELMPLAGGSVDYLYAINMIDHVDDMVDACLEIARVLKPSGVLILQSYFNSFPLLAAEPGVFDEFFLESVFFRIFRPIEVATFAVGDPRISRSYNCDIIAGSFALRAGWQEMATMQTPRSAWADASHVGVQSIISEAIAALDGGRLDDARREIADLRARNRLGYELHVDLLQMRLHILEGDSGAANILGKELRRNVRLQRNVRGFLTLERLENRRITMADRR